MCFQLPSIRLINICEFAETGAAEDTGCKLGDSTVQSSVTPLMWKETHSGKIYPRVPEGLHLLHWGGSWVQVPALLLTELVTLSQVPGFLGLSFLIHPKLVLEACSLIPRWSLWSGYREPVGTEHLAEHIPERG